MMPGKIDVEVVGTLQQRIESCLNVLDVLLTSSQAIVSSVVIADKNCSETTHDSQMTLIKSVMKIMGLRDIKTISKNASLAEVGMDSLMSVEIKQVLEREYDVFLTAQQLRSITFGKLEEMSTASNDVMSMGRELHLDTLFRNLGDEKNSDQTLLAINAVTKKPTILFIPGKRGTREICQNPSIFLKFPPNPPIPSNIFTISSNSSHSLKVSRVSVAAYGMHSVRKSTKQPKCCS